MAGDSKRNPRALRRTLVRRIDRGRIADAHFRRVLMGLASDERGQSTVEYAVVMAASLTVVVALGLLWNAVDGGMFVQHAVASASHNVQGAAGGVTDVFCY